MPTALIVDDNAINRKLLNRMLNKMGWGTFEVSNGALALAAFKNDNFPLILMDIQMPVMNGIEATLAIRTFEKVQNLSNGTYILAVTAHGYPGYQEKCIGYGMNAYLAKPFTFGQLQAKLELVT